MSRFGIATLALALVCGCNAANEPAAGPDAPGPAVSVNSVSFHIPGMT